MNTTNTIPPFDCPECGRTDMKVDHAARTITCPGCNDQFQIVPITRAELDQMRRKR